MEGPEMTTPHQYLTDRTAQIRAEMLLGDERPKAPASISGDFGPPHGFAGLGDVYMSNVRLNGKEIDLAELRKPIGKRGNVLRIIGGRL